MSNNIMTYIYSKFANNSSGELNPSITSNWSRFQVPKQLQLKKRVFYEAFVASDQSMPQIADPYLLQSRGNRLAVAPEGYIITHIHFCNSIPQGVFIQPETGSSKELIYIGLAELNTASPVEQMLNLLDSPSNGVFGFGSLSVDQFGRIITGNSFEHSARGLHTIIPGPFRSPPRATHLTVNFGQSVDLTLPSFNSYGPLIDESVLVGVCVSNNDIVYIFGYPFDVQAIGRIYAIDRHNLIQKTADMLKTCDYTTQEMYKLAFVEALLAVIDSPIAEIALTVDLIEVGIENAEEYFNGNRVFVSKIEPSNDLDSSLATICSAASNAGRKLCACFNLKEPHPCLNYQCVSGGYKPLEIADKISPSECEEAISRMEINYLNCSVYNQEVAGGYMAINTNIQEQCIEQVGTDAQTINIREQEGGSEKQKTTSESQAEILMSRAQAIFFTYELYIYAGIFILMCCIVAIVVYAKKRKDAALQVVTRMSAY